MKMRRRLPLVIFFTVLIMLGLVFGSLNIKSAYAVAKDRYADLQMFTKVLNLVEQHYVEEVDIKKLIYGGIKGMLGSLDPHTNFLPPEIFKEFRTETSGEFGGVGIEITIQDDVLTVISPIEDTPAFKAGIKSGDKVVEIDGKSTKGNSLAEAVNKMRGKTGSSVTISIWREGFEKPKKYVLAREKIKVRSVKATDMGDGYLYARITSFIERTGDDLRAAIEKQESKGTKITGLVLDLRNNPGGLLDQAIKVCNTFISEGVIVSTIGRNKKDKEVVLAKKEGSRTDFPIIVLINDYSASASEIVAGALQDHKRAAIMGTRSFGKGSVQSVVDLGDGAGLKLTVARYYTPSGRSIQALGIEPDIKVDPVDAVAFEKAIIHKKSLHEADIEGHLINEAQLKDKDGADAKNKDEDKDGEEGVIFWKKDKVKDAESEAKKLEEEDAKLPPKERLLKRDYQVSQALNYLKSWSLFKQISSPKTDTAKADDSGQSEAQPSSATTVPKVTPALPEKKKVKSLKVEKKEAAKKPTPVKPAPSAAPAPK
jgi:carboxyl-terminal processing protease